MMPDSIDMNDFAIVPSRGEGFVELSRTSTGRLFKKHILSTGPLLYPKVKGGRVDIDTEFLERVKANFDNKVCDIVQVPLADDKNSHSEDPSRNIGEVVELTIEDDKLYAIIDARKHAEDVGKTLLGASAMMSLSYTDNRTQEVVGPTLLHVAVTNRPYVQELDPYEEIIAASADSSSEAVFLTIPEEEEVEPAEESSEEGAANPTEDTSSEEDTAVPNEEKPMELEELYKELKEKHGVDVPSLQQQLVAQEAAVALSNEIIKGIRDTNVLELSSAEPNAEEIVTTITTLATDNVELTNKLTAITEATEREAAETLVDGLVGEGKVLPKQRDAYVELKLTNSEMFDKLVPEEAVLQLSNEQGGDPDEGKEHEATIQEQIDEVINSPAFQNYAGKQSAN